MDTFAATATSVGARLLLEILAERNCRGEKWVAVFEDVKIAFRHASLLAGRRVMLQLSETEDTHYWMAQRALYGLREAPRRFQENLNSTVSKHGWTRLRTDPMLYIPDYGALIRVFADDMLL
eukprot:7913185-Heterocapsa_arctica.AAC.1